jgi:hypothetical protein
MKKAMAVIIVAMQITACKNAEHLPEERKDGFSETAKTPEDSLFQLVMHGHDEGMAKTGKIKAYQTQTNRALDSINALKSFPDKRKLQLLYKDVAEELNYAEFSMNEWMTTFNPDSAKENITARLKYLATEQLKVEKVTENIKHSLKRADSLLHK